MKTTRLKLAISSLIISVLLISNVAKAQQGQGQMPQRNQAQCSSQIPDLSEDQKSQITKLKTQALKETTTFRNQLAEKRAHLKTLSTAENADQKAIDAEIDAISSLRAKIMKVQAKLRQDIRALLSDDQRVYFDNNCNRGGRYNGKGHHQQNRGQKGMSPCLQR